MFRRLIALAVVLALVIAAGLSSVAAVQPQTVAANAAVTYIKSLQNPDGGFPAFGSSSTPGSTLDVVFALVSHGEDATMVTNAGNGPDDYLSAQAASYASDAGAAAKLALGVSLMGLDITNFGGQNLQSIMNANYNTGDGSYGLDVFDELFYVFALKRAGLSIPAGVGPYLLSIQQPDGGWEFAPGFGTDGNTTAMVLEALLSVGTLPSATPFVNGLSYLHGTQNADGGFGYLGGGPSDPNSTALVIQTLMAAGQNVDASGPWVMSGNTPMTGLLSFRNVSTGAFQYAGFDNAYATYQAVPALLLAPFPNLQTVASVGGTAKLPALDVPIARTGGGDEGLLLVVAALVAGGMAIGGGGFVWQARRRRRRVT